jgi:hypothetical protein
MGGSLRVFLGEPLNAQGRFVPERVDALVIVSGDEHVNAAARELVHEFDVGRVQVLILVNDEVMDPQYPKQLRRLSKSAGRSSFLIVWNWRRLRLLEVQAIRELLLLLLGEFRQVSHEAEAILLRQREFACHCEEGGVQIAPDNRREPVRGLRGLPDQQVDVSGSSAPNGRRGVHTRLPRSVAACSISPPRARRRGFLFQPETVALLCLCRLTESSTLAQAHGSSRAKPRR